MATNGYTPVHFCFASETAFYFEVAGTDVEEDIFRRSDSSICQHLIGSNQNKYLILNDEGQFQVKNLTIEQQCQPDCKFNIQFYKDSSLAGGDGRAVMLYVNKDGKTMVACCNEKHEIHPVEMALPFQIGASAHKAVFYQMKLSGSKYLLESSLYRSEFLGFESDENDNCLSKLVLCCKERDEVDESCEVIFSKSCPFH